MPTPTNILPSNVPLIGPRNLMAADWYRYFTGQNRTVNAAIAGEVLTSPGSGLAGGGSVADGISLSIAPNGVENTMIRQSLATSVIGRFQGTGGNVADIQATFDDVVLGRFGGILEFRSVSSIPSTVADGDYGDITVSGSGLVWTIDNTVVTYAKIQNISAASKLLGRGSASGAGSTQEITLGTGLTMSGTTLNGSAGTVTTVSVVTANGVSGSVATATTTPAITLTLGNITPGDMTATGQISGTSVHASTTIASFLAGGGTAVAGLFGASSYGAVQAYTNGSGTAKGLALNPSGGQVLVGASSPSAGTDFEVVGTGSFSGNLTAPNQPNAYVEGTFTPVLNLGGATTGITYTTQQGRYTRIGRMVFITINITLSSKGSATGAATITGLPITSAAAPASYGTLVVNSVTLVGAAQAVIPAAGTTVNLLNFATSALGNLADTNLTNTSLLTLSMFYTV